MDTWLDRVDPDRTFLLTEERPWTYGQAVAEVAARIDDSPRTMDPELTPEAVFDLLAGVFGGGALIGGLRGDPAGAALVVPTSGTTGGPKGVRLSMANLKAAASASTQHLGSGADDMWHLAMPLSHVAGISILLRQAWSGGSVLMQPSFEPAATWSAIGRGATMLSVVPTMLHRMLEFDAAPDIGRLRAVLVGGGPTPGGLLERARARALPVLPTYGLTETFGQVATLRPGAALEPKAHPLPGVEFRVEGDGRLAIRSPQVSPGYLGEPDRDEEWLVTNDLAELDGEGAVRILGRADTLIITGGEKVSPERVEAELAQHPGVDEVVVVGVPDSEWGEKVVCAYGGDIGPEELSSWLKERLPGFMVPKTWIPMASIPRTSIGKPDRGSVSAAAAGESA